MHYQEIELKGFKRISLNKIEKITIRPDKKFHWILGTNGAGKSSLLKEISPLAAIPASYLTGGYKKVIITHKGVTYTQLSDFSGPKNKFSFIKAINGVEEELNPGHTSTVFNNLVLQVFGYTKEIHSFAIGAINFSSMSGVERKHWLTKWSDADYTFALNYFQKLFTSYKHALGSIKTDQNRIIEAKTKMVGVEDVIVLESEIAALKDKLRFLTEVCPNPSRSKEVVWTRINQLQDSLVLNRKRLRQRLTQQKELLPLESPEGLDQRSRQIEAQIYALESNSKIHFERLEEIQRQLDQHVLLQNADQKTLETDNVQAFAEIETIKNSLAYSMVVDPQRARENFQSWLSDLGLLVPELVVDHEGDLNEANYTTLVEKLRQGHHALAHYASKIQETRTKLAEAQSCDHAVSQECPACHHQWVPGKTEADIYQLETLLTEFLQKEASAKEKMSLIQEDVDKHTLFKRGQDMLNAFVWKHEAFKPFWEVIFLEKLPSQNPEAILLRAFSFQNSLDQMSRILELEDLIRKNLHKLEMLKNTSATNVQVLMDESTRLEAQIAKDYEIRATAVDQQQTVKSKIQLQKFLNDLRDVTEKEKKEYDQLYLVAFEHQQREGLSEFILQTNTEILSKEKQLRSVEIQKAQIKMLEDNLSSMVEFSKVLKAAVDELSPSKGLIAKGLTGFINHMVGLVNSIIGKVWLYPMALKPILPDEDDTIELDYKFKVDVDGEETPDIADCSSGQQEIINRAFQIVGLAFMRLDHGPLFLDEFGARMDTAHKAAAFEMISKLLVHSNFSQIFMISHFEGTHTQGLDADITVLCPNNIELPNGVDFNQVTKIA